MRPRTMRVQGLLDGRSRCFRLGFHRIVTGLVEFVDLSHVIRGVNRL